jgi:hypothetical protein
MDADTLIAQLRPALNLHTPDSPVRIIAVRQLQPQERRTEYDIIMQTSTDPDLIHPGGATLPSDRITGIKWHPHDSRSIRLSVAARSKDGAEKRTHTFVFLGSPADIMNAIVAAQDAGVWQMASEELSP